MNNIPHHTHDLYLAQNLLVEFQPGLVSLAVRVLQAKKPNFSQSDCFHHLDTNIHVSAMLYYGPGVSTTTLSYLIKQLLSGGVWLDGKLQLGINSCHSHVNWLRHFLIFSTNEVYNFNLQLSRN